MHPEGMIDILRKSMWKFLEKRLLFEQLSMSFMDTDVPFVLISLKTEWSFDPSGMTSFGYQTPPSHSLTPSS